MRTITRTRTVETEKSGKVIRVKTIKSSSVFLRVLLRMGRLEIIELLLASYPKAMTVTALVNRLRDFEQSEVSTALSNLYAIGIVDREKVGKWREYTLNVEDFAEIQGAIIVLANLLPPDRTKGVSGHKKPLQ